MEVEADGLRCSVTRSDSPPHLLSPREQEIARMIAAGFPNKTIAAVLEISTWTVSTYLRRMFAKLHVTSRAAMIAKLMEE
ncbi:MAG TPA: helix-turn-helix transcriptional regulator [Thermoanaerobaculia bacterium]|nr:helix-turn-helix transcriptional regulator [Thermoanaerobaculia bacterium]